MSDAQIALLLEAVLAAVVVLAVLLRRLRRGTLTAALLAAVLTLAAAWNLALVAVVTHYRDADGFIDCWPACSFLQTAVGSVLLYGLLLVAFLGAVTVVGLLKVSLDRRRSRA